jgi:hypothetical protein
MSLKAVVGGSGCPPDHSPMQKAAAGEPDHRFCFADKDAVYCGRARAVSIFCWPSVVMARS